jgi:hypothetical protein
MSKGAIAVAVAMAHPEPETAGRGKNAVARTAFPMVTESALSHARAVIKHAPDLADSPAITRLASRRPASRQCR